MSEFEIKKIVSKYRKRAALLLGVFSLMAIAANWFLISQNIERRFELGLTQETINQGFTWGAIILGLNVVLWLGFYSMEKVLIEIYHSKNRA
jgi:hypothetical protein